MTNQTILQRSLWKYACLGAIVGTASGYAIDRIGGYWTWGFAILIFVCFAFGTFWIENRFLTGIYGLDGSPPRPYMFRFLLRDFWLNPKGGSLFLLLWILGAIHLFGPIIAAGIASEKAHRRVGEAMEESGGGLDSSDAIQVADSFVSGVAASPFAILAFIPGAVVSARLRYRAWRASSAALPTLVAEIRHSDIWVRLHALIDLKTMIQRHGIKGSAAHQVIAVLIAVIRDDEAPLNSLSLDVLSVMGAEAAEAAPVVLATLRKYLGRNAPLYLVPYFEFLDKHDPGWKHEMSTLPKSDD